MMYTSTLTATLFLLLSAIPRTINAQQVADGLIVPFTSGLPACASVCGPLFDVQGACTPPNIAATSDSCFCSDARLTPISTDSGTTGVSQVCGTSSPESCTAASDLQAVKTWYSNFCSTKTGSTTTSSSGATAATGTGSSSATASSGSSSSSSGSSSGASQTWIQRTYPWVIMLVVITLAIVLGWIAACIFRRRYLRRKEREFEMRPPVVAWGPHQHQSMTGGVGGLANPNHTYGDGVVNRGGNGTPMGRGTPTVAETGQLGGHYKEARRSSTPANVSPVSPTGDGRESGRGWGVLSKSRR